MKEEKTKCRFCGKEIPKNHDIAIMHIIQHKEGRDKLFAVIQKFMTWWFEMNKEEKIKNRMIKEICIGYFDGYVDIRLMNKLVEYGVIWNGRRKNQVEMSSLQERV